ncbi:MULTISPECIES: NAD-dependent epimerase/dehydratase family protein [Pseudomonas]|jgi:UDP-2-acetamido-2,6-beta-L-arabino-hexul-4-ose reductase|uniref:UDP-2-acetamido-2,6-beta-L-arabino-hexul-4-ose reductase n=1 Tax=Pseudomonas TaxID=286 RepID=UPI000B35B6A2|nr:MULTISPECIES: NAD-dependent epimerase/dehydratase family protein [Pseudomonas]PMY59672.1 bifunctional UDP-4-keto-pentose/UDP-xylose synthase [Pseudomonas sp. FW305-25]PMY60969.1 bifunctional UDP-4-keto-pentose/UDP-xylose synthase [Pseudomonas sp. FW126-L8]PNA69938.1 bifunctional UDP-4-keto-pentose/UDP-xylose synthase [Pseudomonas sp. FW305-76]
MKVLITGINGFIGKNLETHLRERSDIEILRFGRNDASALLKTLVADADCVVHLAGVNRPQDPAEFKSGNSDLTQLLCDAVAASGRKLSVIYTSSTQADCDNPYGVSKLAAEQALNDLADKHAIDLHVFRLPNVFGKWARPNYNSAVATFCHNISRGLPISVHDEQAAIKLVYVDDVIRHFIDILDGRAAPDRHAQVQPVYSTTVGAVAEKIQAFRDSRSTLISEAVGTGLTRALYSTYLSYLPPESFTYEVPKYGDPRGVFVEMLKTPTAGQFSYFTAHPGITRGGHYHHTKTEKFLVIKGHARFRFRQIISGEFYELQTTGEQPVIVETVPGWTHDITNVGSDEMIVMLWANEIFDREHPDTFALPLSP